MTAENTALARARVLTFMSFLFFFYLCKLCFYSMKWLAKKICFGPWVCSRPKWAGRKHRFGVCGPTQSNQIKHDLGSIYVGPLEMPLKRERLFAPGCICTLYLKYIFDIFENIKINRCIKVEDEDST
jgi:hypothetical protein